jgi:predicted nucleic acid-binding protein
MEGTNQDLVVPTLVLGELDYWCGRIGLDEAWLTFLEDVEAGAWRIEHPSMQDLHRARQLQETYRDMRLGVVDATVIALAERLGEDKVATLDHRHFAAARPRHRPALTLLP